MTKHFQLLIIAPAVFAAGAYGQNLGGCPVFPSNNVWNTPIDKLPVSLNSAKYVTVIGPTKPLHPDFGTVYNGAPAGIPYVLVRGSQPKVPISFRYSWDSDPGPYPIPPDAPIEGGPTSAGDRHVLVLETDSCTLYEIFSAYPQPDGSWQGGSGAVFDLKSNNLRPAGKTSADAAGLPMLPGLVRYDEVLSGEIKHAIRFTVPTTQRQFAWPARHFASTTTDPSYPPMGARFRLKANYDVSGFPPEVQVILKALKKYGMFVADNGGAWFISGAPDMRWNDNNLHQLTRVLGSNFEAVDQSSLMVNVDSAEVNPATQLPGGAQLYAVQANPATTTSGTSNGTHRLSLTGPAPAGGAVVALSSSNPAVVSVPPTVTIPAGASGSIFTATGGVVATTSSATITAFYLGVIKTTILQVTSAVLYKVVAYGYAYPTGNGRIDLTGTAAGGGYTVYLSSSNTSVMTVPAQFTVPAGTRSVYFPIQYPGAGTATLTATAEGVTKTFTFTR